MIDAALSADAAALAHGEAGTTIVIVGPRAAAACPALARVSTDTYVATLADSTIEHGLGPHGSRARVYLATAPIAVAADLGNRQPARSGRARHGVARDRSRGSRCRAARADRCNRALAIASMSEALAQLGNALGDRVVANRSAKALPKRLSVAVRRGDADAVIDLAEE